VPVLLFAEKLGLSMSIYGVFYETFSTFDRDNVAIHADSNIAEQYQDGTGLKSSLTQTGSSSYSL
jgi:hypothetical protein